MTDIPELAKRTDELDKLAREIVKAQHLGVGKVALVRLGLEAGEQRGMNLQRVRDAEIAESVMHDEIAWNDAETECHDAACYAIAQAIRALT